MRWVELLAAVAFLGCGCATGQTSGGWTAVPGCGAAPSADDMMNNSALWQCSKAQFAQSQSDYAAGVNAFSARVPAAERPALTARIDGWNQADQQKCTKQASLDFGCAIAANYARARILTDAAAKCAPGACHVEALP